MKNIGEKARKVELKLVKSFDLDRGQKCQNQELNFKIWNQK